ncbi:MAG: sel1 repeat family protein [Thalassococcus sp.]|uniref:tetratricopeptide repeat protein n=1 Tax=Thalassococcus sp. TaxID=1928858 RepID=UPI001B233029|nr:hypothetical protein [Thalassococcus sp.]MBO6866119.1 sel1 repeat family protein [Thalassococcus sp.]
MKALLNSALLAALTTAPAFADKLDSEWATPRSYYIKKSTAACAGDEDAFAELFDAATQGYNPVAMTSLAWMISPNQDCAFVRHNAEEWIGFVRRGAEAGYPVAMKNYGNLMLQGEYVPENKVFGLTMLRFAAKEGHATAAADLALIFYEGLYGIPENMELAVAYAEEANNLGITGPLAERMDEITYTGAWCGAFGCEDAN